MNQFFKTALAAVLFVLAAGAHALIIYRPEDHGTMNIIRCYLKIEDESGNDVTYSAARASYAWYYEPNTLYPYEKSYYLSGGMAMHLALRPGKYRISVYTPRAHVQDFPGYESTGKTADDWQSNTFLYNTENPANVIFVSPTANTNGFYNGGWHIDYRAPKFYKHTKPFVTAE